ncbi:hypothetical protein AAC387_Pa06g0229 [Persea americana]
MKSKDPRPSPYPDRRVPMTIMLLVFCGFSFYLGGIYFPANKLQKEDVSHALQLEPIEPKAVTPASLQVEPIEFPECKCCEDRTPCTDPMRWKKYSVHKLAFMERHCPPMLEREECIVPVPFGYKTPIRWPNSRDECWMKNVPHFWINDNKLDQNWLRKDEADEKFRFPGGGTMFPNGVGRYVDEMQELIPGMKDGTIRIAIDTGCGVASWGGELLDRGILTVSLAPRDNHEAQVQFALERGIPAILGIMSTQRLPFPSSSFDMAHCARCLIPWTEFGGIYLLEIHRILRPGGFWVLSGPPVNYQNKWQGWNRTVEELESNYEKLQKMLASMCFKLYNQKDDIAVWQKSSDESCYVQHDNPDVYPPKCDDGTEPDAAWYIPLRPCLVPSQGFEKIGLEATPKWPERLHIASERVSMIPGGTSGAFKQDEKKWKSRVKHYKTLLPVLGTDEIRNVMDMNTVYGGFAAALIDDPVWVINVVSTYSANSLGVVFDRGLIGTYHDWCEAFSTYPRTYDLLHLDGLITDESHRCNMKYVLLEMDRILRPNGYAIIYESSYFLDAILNIAKGVRWSCQKNKTEDDSENEMILICQKEFWIPTSHIR